MALQYITKDILSRNAGEAIAASLALEKNAREYDDESARRE